MPAIIEKTRKFNAMLEAVHGSNVSDLVIAGDWFSIAVTLDVPTKRRGV